MPETKKKKIMVPRVVNGVETMVEMEVDDTGGPSWGANDRHRVINKPIRRVDGPVKVTGAAKFTHDMHPPGMLYGRILKCPHAHAHVKKLDTAPALKIKGVKVAIEANRDALFEGCPVAAVAAVTPEIADDALRAIVVEYEVLPHVVTPDDAIKPGAPQVYRNEDNVRGHDKRGDSEKVLAAINGCDAIVDVEYRTQFIHHACLETHGIVADYRGGDSATIYASTQGTFTIPGDAAGALGLPHSNVTAIVEHMGGGFGSKFGIGAEGHLACRLSKEAKAPVKLMLTRHDEFVMAGNRSGSWQKFKAGTSKDGKLIGVHVQQYRLGGLGEGSQAGQPYLYHSEHVYREAASIHTNIDSSRAMRAPGHPQASYAIESLMDELADKLKMDPVEFRKKNIGDTTWHRQLDRGAKEIGWENRNKIPGGGTGPVKRGIGCGIGAWGGGGGPQCVVDVTIARDGSVVVACGSQDLGTGTRTIMRAIVAEELGLKMDDVIEKLGSSKLGNANASGGSTTAASLSPAVKDAAFNAREAFATRVCQLLESTPDKVTFADGQVAGNAKKLSWKQACAALPAAGIAARGVWKPGLSGNGVHGACFAEVEVDCETGHVRPIKMVQVQDVGLPINRLALESQINGGMIQSLGMALYEGRVMDRELGVMVNPGFGDYKLAGALEMPELVPLIDDEDKRQEVIGVGEAAIVPSTGAIANAVFNACGVRIRDLPITPDKILMALAAKGVGS
jgi:xanthine dehydrogenase YagR molybdenum-binding subunit